MKKLIFLFSIFLIGCAITIYNIDPINEYFSIDFSKYTEIGFLITPVNYTGKYESIGMVEYKLIPGAKYLSTSKRYDPTIYESIPSGYTWIFDDIEFSQAVDSIYFMAKSMGANAIMNFNFSIVYNEVFNNPMIYSNSIKIPGYRITGFAIKRID